MMIYSKELKKVIDIAGEKALIRTGEISTEHFLLGALSFFNEAYRLLQLVGIDVPALKAQIEAEVEHYYPAKDAVQVSSIPYTPRGQRVLDLIEWHYRFERTGACDTRHLLFALIDEGDGIASRNLRQLGVTQEKVVRALQVLRQECNLYRAELLNLPDQVDLTDLPEVLKLTSASRFANQSILEVPWVHVDMFGEDVSLTNINLDWVSGDMWNHYGDMYSGTLRISRGRNPMWSMRYTGKYTVDGMADGLRDKLKQFHAAASRMVIPYINYQYSEDGDWTYKTKVEGDATRFTGCAIIRHKDLVMLMETFIGGSAAAN